MSSIRTIRAPATHVIVSLEDLKDYGWEKATILGILHYYGEKCDDSKLLEALNFVSPERIALLLSEMKRDELLRMD